MRAKFGLVPTAVSKILSFKFISRFTGVITMCLARGEFLHERRWDLEGCLPPQRRQVQELLMV